MARFKFSKKTKKNWKRKNAVVSRPVKRARVTKQNPRVVMGKGFPKTMTMTHKYHEQITVVGASGGLTYFTFSCNGMFDPNITTTGHQPMYFDQCAAVYDHYTVIGSKIRIKVIPFNSVQPAFRCVLYTDDNATSFSSISGIAEQTSGKIIIVPAAANNPYVFNSKFSTKKAFPGSILANTDLYGTAAANPLEQEYYTFALQACDTTSSVSCYLDYEIEYIAVWKEIKEVGQS